MLKANTAKKTEFLALPNLPWGDERGWWDCLAILPSRLKHDSGWSHIAIIGIRHTKDGDVAESILAMPDDIALPNVAGSDYRPFRMDSYYPSGVLRLWSRGYEFSVDSPTSSVDILIRPKEKKQ